MVSPHVQHTVANTLDSATLNVTVGLGHIASATDETPQLRVKVIDRSNATVVQTLGRCLNATCSTDNVRVASPALWSPPTPELYTAVLELVGQSGLVLDHMEVRFGFRKLDVIGYHWKLNGAWLYLHGYGDDSIYPESMSPPLNHTFYTERLKLARSLGMNFVRHHSHILPTEYFEAACEQGIMVSAEFPIAYGPPPDCATACSAFYEEQWSSIIRQIRNYPCVFDYTMDNEDINLPYAKALYKIAKSLDPSRPVNTADGLFGAATDAYPNPSDFRSVQFDIANIPMGRPHIFGIDGNPPVPVISHETGNFVTWPRLDLVISRFTHNIKPYWLQPARDHVASLGLLHENEMWTHASTQLYLFCWKSVIEELRKVEKISGNEWWLIQDFWQGSNGITDTYWVPKLTASEMEIVKEVNAPVVLLIAQPGDDLPLGETEPRMLQAYTSNDTLNTTLHISNYGTGAITNAKITWQLVGTTSSGLNKTLCSESTSAPTVHQGPGTMLLAPIQCRLPDLGSFLKNPQTPLSLTLLAKVVSKDSALIATNQWHSRVYPVLEDGPSPPNRKVYTQPKFCNFIPISNMACSIPDAGTTIPPGSVFVVDYIDSVLLGFAADGATMLVLNNGTGTTFPIHFPTAPARFKTAWWLGNPTDSNMGTVVYNSSAPITSGMALDGWADEGWYRLIEGGQNFVLDSFAQSADILIRSIDLMGSTVKTQSLQDNPYRVMARQKALLWQTKIVKEGSNSGGAMVVCGMNLLVNYCSPGKSKAAVPEAAWVLHRLLEYAFAGPTPSKSMTARVTHCPGCLPEVNVNLCPAKPPVEVVV